MPLYAATSMITKMLATNLLRVCEGPHTMPDSRLAARLFGEKAGGPRSSLPKIDHDRGDKEYDSAEDTYLEASVRLILARIAAASDVAE